MPRRSWGLIREMRPQPWVPKKCNFQNRRHLVKVLNEFIVDNPFRLRDCGDTMKNKIATIICVIAVIAGSLLPAQAVSDNGALAVTVDAIIARPACLVATIVGSALFVVSLPAAIPSKSVKKVADTLVVVPAKATFTRPLGELSSLEAD